MKPTNANESKTVLAVGELLWDILPGGMQLGGAPFNFAYRVNSLGDHAIMASRVGQDELGNKAHAAVAALDVDTSFLQRDAQHPTGTVEVHFDEDHQPDYFIVPDVAYDYLQTTPSLRHIARNADCICFGTLAQRSATARQTLGQLLDDGSHALKVLDINLRKDCYSRQTVDQSLAHADVVKLNDDEVRTMNALLQWSCDGVLSLCDEILARYSVQYNIVTFGADGALVCARDATPIYEPGYRVHVADSVGSGDAFTAAFVHRLLHGAGLRDACRFGNLLGAIVATQIGATEPITAAQIEQFEAQQNERNGLCEFVEYSVA
jgi:fructokinase